jgi:hypothetical protein
MDLFELIDDDDEEIVDFLNHQRRMYTIIRVRVDHMTLWDDQDFRIRFRISKDVVIQVLELINDQISSQSDR